MNTEQSFLPLDALVPAKDSRPVVENISGFPVDQLPPPSEAKRPSEEMLENCREWGIIYPLLVYQVNGRYIVRDGQRRQWCAILLKIPTVDLKVISVDAVRANVLGLALNEHRSPNPVVEMRMLMELIKAGANVTDVSIATGMTPAKIKKRLQLASLDERLLAEVERGNLRAAVAERAAKLNRDEQSRAVAIWEKNCALTHHDVSDLRRAEAQRAVDSLPADVFAPEGVAKESGTAWRSNVRRLIDDAIRLIPTDDASGLRAKLSAAAEAAA